jgi:hypothetical protein
MRGVRVALIVALGLVAIVLAAVLSGSPPSVARETAPFADARTLAQLGSGDEVCQGGEVLPRGTSAIRVWLEAVIGPPLALTARAGGRVLTGGRRGAGWSTGSVTIPVRPVLRASSGVTICVHLGRAREPVRVRGVGSSARDAAHDGAGERLPGRVLIEDLRSGEDSWWSLASLVAGRMGLGHAVGGPWTALLALGLAAAMVAVTSWLLLREPA